MLSIINLTKVSIREQIAFACLYVSLLLFSCHFLPVWNDSTSFSRAVVVPNDRCLATVYFYYFSIGCLCIEELENPSVNFLFARRSFSRPSHSRPFNLLCDWTSQFLIASACRHCRYLVFAKSADWLLCNYEINVL